MSHQIATYARLIGLDLSRASDSELQTLYEEALTLLPMTAPIYIGTEKLSLRERIAGTLKTFEICQWRLNRTYRPRLRALRDMFRGRKRCFVIGNGPSLNRTDLAMLKNEVTFAVNSFFLKSADLDWLPTFFVVEDHLVAEDRAAWIHALKGPTKLFPTYLGYCLDEAPDTIFFNHRPRVSYPQGFDFSTDAADITYTGCTVTFTVLQLAHYLGFETIHLLGVDADYVLPKDVAETSRYGVGVLDMKSNDPNHFHPDYFGKGFRWHDPQVDKMVEAYQEAEKVTRAMGRPIVNSGVGGKLSVFERVPFGDVFPAARSPEAVEEANLKAQGAKEARAAGGTGNGATGQGAKGQGATGQGMITPKALTALCRERLAREGRAGRALGPGWGGAVHAGFPRVLLVDFTPVGGGSATGEIKDALIGHWPRSELMEISALGEALTAKGGALAAPLVSPRDRRADRILSAATAFAPDVVLYRPVAERPDLHRLLAEILMLHPVPVLTSFMDDWMLRLFGAHKGGFEAFDHGIRILLEDALFCLAISDPMADLLEARYGLPARAIANGIEPAAFAAVRDAAAELKAGRGGLKVRYAGGLAGDMGLASLLALAEAVQSLAGTSGGEGATLEIKTSPHGLKQAGESFAAFPATTVFAEEMSRADYQAWLAEADITVIAYNFDAASLAYVRHSLANKLPECLASGAALLAIGPEDCATMMRLAEADAGVRVTEEGTAPIAAALTGLMDPAARAALVARQVTVAETEFALLPRREALRRALAETAAMPVDPDMPHRLAGAAIAAAGRWRNMPAAAPAFLPAFAG
ncbi:6-hydroxymethylpterin diphosphokinase MptE-like protein [Acuticoccus yangtzensis]|uniref:6-hydroxymethylpterin diphosphokinase MptE-like protein n=1 Tax=Acuticoccus yangtzensis TaxID=1443441 RepID=UPI0009495C6E|nr:6-hydroxymethylpterin diphosphokinase MptE-like protein [Acuticoccus yangtzensis]